jgi:hypothetical protein
MNAHVHGHERANELLPWLINGRLQGADLAWLNEHLESCAACRDELALQHRVRDAVASQPTVEFAPQSSFNRLWQRIEADAAIGLPTAASKIVSHAKPRWRWMVYGVAAQLLIGTIFGVALWNLRAPAPPANYHTVTSAPTVSSAALNVVFDDAVTLADVKEILSRAGLTTVSGPTTAGVFALAADAQQARFSIDDALATLRADPRVRFAERSNDQQAQ